jgi:hypothetical protein
MLLVQEMKLTWRNVAYRMQVHKATRKYGWVRAGKYEALPLIQDGNVIKAASRHAA